MTIKEFNEKLKEMINQVMETENAIITDVDIRYTRRMGCKPLIQEVELRTGTFN